MQTRRLRLGDVVDDYCPRERRLSNHVIVAMVDETIKQTRCATCDFEHPYKDAKVPARRKKKDDNAALFQQVLDGVTTERLPLLAADVVDDAPAPTPVAAAPAPAEPTTASVAQPAPSIKKTAAAAARVVAPKGVLRPAPREEHEAAATSPASVAPAAIVPAMEQRATVDAALPLPSLRHRVRESRVVPPVQDEAIAAPRMVRAGASVSPAAGGPADAAPQSAAPQPGHEAPQTQERSEDDAPLHRRALIRATLPRPVGEVPVRQIPSFTIREAAAARPNKFRYKARPPGGGTRPGRPQGPGMPSLQGRPANARGGPQGRGGKKAAPGHQPQQRANGGPHSPRGPKGPQGNKRFK